MTWQPTPAGQPPPAADPLSGRPTARADAARRRVAGAIALARRAVRALLASEPRAKPGRLSVGWDAVLALVATIAVLAAVGKTTTCSGVPLNQCLAFGPGPGPAGQDPVHHLSLFPAVMTTAPLVLRRVRPLTAFWLVVIGALVAPHQADNVITLAAVVIAAYSAVVHSRFRRAAMISVPLAGVLVATAFPAVAEPLRLPGRATALWALIPVVIVGRAVDEWRQRAGDSQARLDQLQREHEAATTLALARERARIASELHDVVTHNVSVMIVQAGAARQVLTQSPAEATDALLAVESSGRAAMSELRHLLGLLSPAGPEGAAGPGDPAGLDADLRPQPGLGQLTALVDRVRAAGLDVDLLTGPLPGLSPGQDLTAYRVIQEALTNVLKHAGMAWTNVSLDYRQGQLIAEVANAVPPAAASVPPPEPGTGRGLLGLRERVELYGGELQAGPLPDGGWLVRASLPVSDQPSPGPLASTFPTGAQPAGEQPGEQQAAGVRPDPAPVPSAARS
jgi:signal transduction histidine kinase